MQTLLTLLPTLMIEEVAAGLHVFRERLQWYVSLPAHVLAMRHRADEQEDHIPEVQSESGYCFILCNSQITL